MGLRALHRHRHMPAAAALIGVLLYTALVASHVVSQATSLALPGAPGAVAQFITTGDPGCHETQPSAGKARSRPRLSSVPHKEMSLLRGICGSAHQRRRRSCQHSMGEVPPHIRGRRQWSADGPASSLLASSRSPAARLTDNLNRASE